MERALARSPRHTIKAWRNALCWCGYCCHGRHAYVLCSWAALLVAIATGSTDKGQKPRGSRVLSTGTACKATWIVFGPGRRPWLQHQQQVVGLQAQELRPGRHLPPVPPATTAPAPAVPATGCTSSGSTHPGRCLRGRGVSPAHHSTLDGSSGLLLGVHVAHTEELAGWLGLYTAAVKAEQQYSSGTGRE